MRTLIYEDAGSMTYERVTPNGVIVEVIPKNPDRSQPAYKSAAVHIAAEKLGVLAAIEAAIDVLINRAGDKSLYVWWEQIDTISRADAEWQQIEAEVDWGKDVTPEALFELAAQV